MKRKVKIIIENNYILVGNYVTIEKIEISSIIIDYVRISGSNLKIIEIDDGKVKIYGEVKKIEFIYDSFK